MEIFIDLTQEERSIADAYAKAHSLAWEDAFKLALFEKIKAEHECAPADSTSEDFPAIDLNTGNSCERNRQLAEDSWLSDALVGVLGSDKEEADGSENA